MKLLMFVGAVTLLLVAKGALAACSQPAVQVINLGQDLALFNLLSGNTVCASRDGDSWQEEHRGGGQLWDYKLGPSDPVDPTKQVGTWAVTGNNFNTVVEYNYGSDGPYSYEVWDNGGGSYSFCNGAEEIQFTLTGIGSGC